MVEMASRPLIFAGSAVILYAGKGGPLWVAFLGYNMLAASVCNLA